MRTGLLIDDNYDLVFANGKLVEGQTDQQHIDLLVIINKGELKDLPTVGFGIARRIRSVPDQNRFVRELRVELEADGYNDVELDVTQDLKNFKITI